MTRRRDDGDPSGIPAVSPIPDAAEMEATDHYLDRLAAGAAPAPSDAAGRLLRDAAAPGEEPELAGSAAFAAAVAASVEERSTATSAPRTFTVLGRVVTAKVVAIVALATLGLAGAGAATGAVLHAADRRSPASTTVEVVPDTEAPEAPGGEPDADTSGRRHHPGELSLAEATERIATCDAATSAQGAERLVEAAAAATTPTDFCAEAVATIESMATGADADTTTDTVDAGETDERGAGNSNGTDPAGNAAEHRDDAATGHTPTTGRPGAGSGGSGNAGGNTSNSGGNANANAGGANSGGNANPNAGGANSGGNANPNAGGANASPSTPNANANANANRTSTTPGSSSTGAAATGARSTGQGAASSPGRSRVIPWGVCAAECSAPPVTDPPTPAAASTSNRSSATSAPRTAVSASDPRSRP